MVVGEHRELCDVAVGHRQLATRWQWFEQLDRELGLFPRGGVVAGEPGEAREPTVGLALAQAVTAAAVLVERAPTCIDRALDLVSQVALVRTPLQQRGPALGRELVCVAQGTLEMSCGFTVRPECSRTFPCRGRVTQHRLLVAGSLSVVREPREICWRCRLER